MNAITTHRNALGIGTRIDRYEIEAIIGHGGFGISYRAVDVRTGERVALKEFLPTELATREADDSVYPLSESHVDDFKWGLERFLDEVNLQARFRHPSIVRVHRAFKANGTGYMEMAYEDGESLATRLKREGTLDADALAAITMPLLDGLEIVHEAGFIHRDIKPSNIYLRNGDGGPALLDFGSAREALRGKTRTLTALVSAGYAPLEQYFSRSDLQGPWSDIYGLGATMYEAITGAAPIDAVERSRGVLGSTRDILPAAAEAAAGDYPPYMLAAVDHALRMEAQDRPRNIAEWRRELTGERPVPEQPQTNLVRSETRVPTIVGLGSATDATRPLRERPGLFSLIAVMLLAAASLMWWQWSGVDDAFDTRIAEPRPWAAESHPDGRLAALREALKQANSAAESSRRQIDALTARLAELEALRDARRRDSAALKREPMLEQNRTREQEAIIAELRGALEAANRESHEARREADDLATRLALLEAVRTPDDGEPADRRKEIDDLLAVAEDDVRRLRLTTPAGENAHERYRRVLEIDAGNAEAQRGLERIVEKYIEFAALAQNDGDLSKARRYLDRAARVLPDDPRLIPARRSFAQAKDRVEPAPAGNRTRTQRGTRRQRQLDTNVIAATLRTPQPGTTAPAAATPEPPGTHSPSSGTTPSMAFLPNEWASGTSAPHNGPGDIFAGNLGDEIVEHLVTRGEFRILYDYRDGDANGEVPDAAVLWKGNAVKRKPHMELVYRVGERLGVDVVLMWRARPVSGFDSWPVDIHLVDIKHRRKFHVEGSNRKVVENVNSIVQRYLDAEQAAVDGAGSKGKTESSAVSVVSAPNGLTTPARVALLPFARRRYSTSPFHALVSRELSSVIETHDRLRLAYSFYSRPDDKGYAAFSGLWTGGPVSYQVDKEKAIDFARALDVDVVVTAQMPIGHLGQWSFKLDEEEELIDIFLIDVRSGTLYRDNAKIKLAGKTLSGLVTRADMTGALQASTASFRSGHVGESRPDTLRVVIFPTSAGSWSTFNHFIVPDIARQLTNYVLSEPGLTLTYSFYADSAPGNLESTTYWNGAKALKKPDIPAIVSATRELGGDVAVAVFHWNTTGMVDNIGSTLARLYVIDVVNGKDFMRAGSGAEIARLADAALVELSESRVALSRTEEADSVN